MVVFYRLCVRLNACNALSLTECMQCIIHHHVMIIMSFDVDIIGFYVAMIGFYVDFEIS